MKNTWCFSLVSSFNQRSPKTVYLSMNGPTGTSEAGSSGSFPGDRSEAGRRSPWAALLVAKRADAPLRGPGPRASLLPRKQGQLCAGTASPCGIPEGPEQKARRAPDGRGTFWPKAPVLEPS